MRRTEPSADALGAWYLLGPLASGNRNCQRGTSESLSPTRRNATLLNTGVLDDEQDATASVMTISVGVLQDSAPDDPQFVQAELLWGTAGHQHRAIIDVTNNTVVQVAASYVRLNAFLVEKIDDNNTTPRLGEGVAEVGATIGYGHAGRPSVRFTQQIFMEENQVIVPVPKWAHSFSAVSTFAKSCDFLTANSNANIIGTTSFDATNPEIPVPGVCSHIQFNGTQGATYSVCWNLYI